MLDGLEDFIGKINNSEIGCLKEIVRIKNGFKNIAKWKNSKNAEYCDVKINAIFCNPKDGSQMIIEIQLLSLFLFAVCCFFGV